LRKRDELKLKNLMNEKVKKVNPIFFMVEGTVEEWEKPKYNAVPLSPFSRHFYY